MGSPGAGKPHTGQYGELTPSRQRGGAGSACPLPTNFMAVRDCRTLLVLFGDLSEAMAKAR